MTDLDAYVAANRRQPGFQAWIETIPEWDDILKAWKDGASASLIRRYLLDKCGYDPALCTQARVGQHLYKNYPRAHLPDDE